MGTISRKECIKELIELFNLKTTPEKNKGWVSYNEEKEIASFLIDKRYMWRHDIINKLMEYFGNKYIEDGHCRIDNITLVYTTFHIEPLTPEEIEKDKELEKKYSENN